MADFQVVCMLTNTAASKHASLNIFVLEPGIILEFSCYVYI